MRARTARVAARQELMREARGKVKDAIKAEGLLIKMVRHKDITRLVKEFLRTTEGAELARKVAARVIQAEQE